MKVINLPIFAALGYGFNFLVDYCTPEEPIEEEEEETEETNKSAFRNFVGLTLIAPMLEEIACRGFIQTFLLRNICKISPNTSTVIVSTFFTCLHIPNELLGTTEFVNKTDKFLHYFSIFSTGICTGFITEKTNLLGAIAFHTGFNFHPSSKAFGYQSCLYISEIARSYLPFFQIKQISLF